MATVAGPRVPLLLTLLLPVLAAAVPAIEDETGFDDLSRCSDPISCEEASSVSFVQASFQKNVQQNLDSEAGAREAFMAFIREHKRSYEHDAEQFQERFSHFRASLAAVEEQNSRPNRLWTAGINHLADWSPQERKQLLGWSGGAAPRNSHVALSQGKSNSIASLPAEFTNWTRLETAHEIFDQGGCGSCWAAASATVLKAHSEIYSTKKVFSVQELVSCVFNPMACGGTGGCSGATAELAMDYVAKYGLRTESELPYQGLSGPCIPPAPAAASSVLTSSPSEATSQAETNLMNTPGVHAVQLSTSTSAAAGMLAWEKLPENRMEPLMRAVVEHGPVIISVAAGGAWNSYLSGVFNGCVADAVINHAVMLLGYGHDSSLGVKYWEIQNSWGPTWGETGHMRILRRDDDDSQCGTDYQPEVGTGCRGGPTSVTVCGMCGILYDSVVPHYN